MLKEIPWVNGNIGDVQQNDMRSNSEEVAMAG